MFTFFILMLLGLREGDRLPDFTTVSWQGDTIVAESLVGKVIILDFWATWCPPCRMELPGFVELYDEYNKKGLEIIGFCLDEDTVGLGKFLRRFKINYPIVLDDSVVHMFGRIKFIPTTFVVDKKGVIRRKFIGYRRKEEFEDTFLELLAE